MGLNHNMFTRQAHGRESVISWRSAEPSDDGYPTGS